MIKFSIENVYMYCYEITITDRVNTYSAIVECSAYEDNTLLIWLDDFLFTKITPSRIILVE